MDKSKEECRIDELESLVDDVGFAAVLESLAEVASLKATADAGAAARTIKELSDIVAHLKACQEDHAEEMKEKDEEIEGLQAEIAQVLDTVGWTEHDWDIAKGHGRAPNGRLVSAL